MKENLLLKEAKQGQGRVIPIDIKYPKYAGGDWKKIGYTHKSSDGSIIEINYMKQTSTGKTEGYKIIDYGTVYKKKNGNVETIIK